MTRIIGRLTSLGLGREPAASRGVAVPPTYWIPVRSLDFDEPQDWKDNESGFGTIDDAQDGAILRQWSTGSYEGKIYDQSEGLLMRSLFGQAPVSTQRTTTGVYDHVYTMANNNAHATMTAAIKEANDDLRAPGSVIDSYGFEAVMDDWVRRTFTLLGRKSAAASNTLSYTNENEFLPKHVSVRMAAAGAASATIDAATAIKARRVALNIAKNATTLPVLGTTDVDDVVNRQVAITGTIEMYYDDLTYKNLQRAGTHQSLRFDVVGETVIGTSGTHTPAIRYELADIAFTSWKPTRDNNDIATQTMDFKGYLNLALGRSIQGRLTNAHSGTNYAA